MISKDQAFDLRVQIDHVITAALDLKHATIAKQEADHKLLNAIWQLQQPEKDISA